MLLGFIFNKIFASNWRVFYQKVAIFTNEKACFVLLCRVFLSYSGWTIYTAFSATIQSHYHSTPDLDGFAVPLSPKLLQNNNFTTHNQTVVVKGSMVATVYIANVKVVKTKWWKKLLAMIGCH